ncbi:MAG: GYD domain-containing protein [Acidobacteriota bacterium]|nr:GYD domain-containing protein [Acidobacteriota bacterium]
MPTYVLMTRLKPGELKDATARAESGREWLERVNKACPEVKWIAHFALLGPYDFMDIYEASDVETAHKVSMISRAAGALTAESWEALPYDRYLELMSEIT